MLSSQEAENKTTDQDDKQEEKIPKQTDMAPLINANIQIPDEIPFEITWELTKQIRV
eukprot:CAMPEP_0202725298 /NCGR_PEP_ID=MMETSP1385-20130828/180786_1 /ASSEMBLY_ACC=CAM_ASM_000861 /TAXON_ID=933848 /ORGANISM="Elphidium margaritaceum" /LENGTH=56 /DNA_ID=CAMNT_0049391283 /DNA_START=15 /DNA_END=182 /DNA_ORIENTATION=+